MKGALMGSLEPGGPAAGTLRAEVLVTACRAVGEPTGFETMLH